jgi:hypothetical protein
MGFAERNQRMPQQPELTSPSLPARPAQQPGAGIAPVSGNQAISEASQPSKDESIPISESALDPLGLSPALLVMQGHPQRIPRWLERAELFLRVLLRMYIGLAVCYAPWSNMFWDQNPIFLQFPTLSIYAANGAVRGLVSGLGLLNLWIAFHDAIRHGTEKQ